jgi:thiamine biosynthesis lipoprotein ApbE
MKKAEESLGNSKKADPCNKKKAAKFQAGVRSATTVKQVIEEIKRMYETLEQQETEIKNITHTSALSPLQVDANVMNINEESYQRSEALEAELQPRQSH